MSPADVIGPAFTRTREFFLPSEGVPGRPDASRFWFCVRMALVAGLASPVFIGVIIAFSTEFLAVGVGLMGISGIHISRSLAAAALHPAALTVAVAVAAFLGIAVAVAGVWLWCRMRFTLFDLVLRRHGRVSQSWSQYGQPVPRFLGLVLLAAVAFVLLTAATVGPIVLHLFLLFRRLTPQQINADPALLLAHILPIYAIFFLVALAAGLTGAIILDFLLPPLALENASVASAVRRFFALAGTDFWWLALYFLLRFVLRLAIAWIGGVAVMIVLLVLGGGGFGLGYLLYDSLWHLGGAAAAVFVIYCMVAGLAVAAAYVLGLMALYGLDTVWVQHYAILFFGSRYQALGAQMGPPPAADPARPAPATVPAPLPEPPPIT